MKVQLKLVKKPPIEIPIQGDTIRLDSFLKLANAVESGGQAKVVIQEGRVKLNDTVCTQRGKKLHLGDEVRFMGTGYRVASGEPA